MANRAILLIEAALGKPVEVVSSLRKLPWVRTADRVTPPYDVIAVVEVDSSKDATEEVHRNLGGVPGITAVIVCPVMEMVP